MTTHSSIPAWEIPWTEEPGRLKKVKVTQSCLTLCDHMDYTNREILQARILERVATPFSRGSSRPRNRTQVSRKESQILYQLSHKGSPRILEWVAYPFSSRSSQPRSRTGVSCIAGGFFTNWAIRKFQATVHGVTKESDTTAIKQQQQHSTQQAVCTFAYASPYKVINFPKVFYQATFITFHTSAPSAASPSSPSWTSSHNDQLPLSHHHHVPSSAHTSILAFTTLSWN